MNSTQERYTNELTQIKTLKIKVNGIAEVAQVMNRISDYKMVGFYNDADQQIQVIAKIETSDDNKFRMTFADGKTQTCESTCLVWLKNMPLTASDLWEGAI